MKITDINVPSKTCFKHIANGEYFKVGDVIFLKFDNKALSISKNPAITNAEPDYPIERIEIVEIKYAKI